MISFISKNNGKLSKVVFQNTTDLSYTTFMKLLRKKDIKVNGKRISSDIAIAVGDSVDIYYCPEKKQKYSVVFEDKNILVINKLSGYTSESVFEDISAIYKDARFIHRLDRNTSGIMVFALNSLAEEQLLKGFKERTFEKEYLAEVKGIVSKNQDTLINYLVKDSKTSTVKIYDKNVKGSVLIKTGYKVIKRNQNTTVLSVKLYTGKTHQIRAHLAYIGYPIVGDGKYGDNEFNKKMKEKSQNLTAYKLTLHFEKDNPLFYLDNKTFEF
ncbi:MAG: RluA family pseudouridine synthase [Clostridia bacterium]|nr:RluA family pseudouridine synthase [Clostridia bacterium]